MISIRPGLIRASYEEDPEPEQTPAPAPTPDLCKELEKQKNQAYEQVNKLERQIQVTQQKFNVLKKQLEEKNESYVRTFAVWMNSCTMGGIPLSPECEELKKKAPKFPDPPSSPGGNRATTPDPFLSVSSEFPDCLPGGFKQ